MLFGGGGRQTSLAGYACTCKAQVHVIGEQAQAAIGMAHFVRDRLRLQSAWHLLLRKQHNQLGLMLGLCRNAVVVAGYIAGQVVSLPQHLHRADEHTEHVDRSQLRQPRKPRSSTAVHEGQDRLQQVGRDIHALLGNKWDVTYCIITSMNISLGSNTCVLAGQSRTSGQ